MSSFALIGTNGLVAQIEGAEFPVAAPLQWVDVSSVTPSPQVGWTYNGSVFAAPAAPPAPTVAQLAATALAAGVAIVSTGTPALSGTYALDPATQQKATVISLYIAVNGKFPAGQTSLPWPDAGGTVHSFASTAEFQVFATALADYATAIDIYGMGEAASLPASPVTIA